MKRPMITFDELMSMSDDELTEFCKRDEQLLAEGLIDPHEPNTDFMGMTIDEIIEKYHFTPMEEVFGKLMKKLNQEDL